MSFDESVWRLVARIPPGRVATYGQIAALLGRPRSARAVGRAMAALGSPRASGHLGAVPWHRVVNASGEISRRPRVSGMLTQRLRLEGEGVRLRRGRVDLRCHRWERRAPSRAAVSRRPAPAGGPSRAVRSGRWLDDEER